MLAFLYAGFLIFYEKIIFQPTKLESSYEFKFNEPYKEFFLETEDGCTLNALLFNTANNPNGFILYFHGNADNLQRWGEYAIDFTSLGYDVLAIDYRGYGKSTGSPSESNLYSDAEFVWNWSNENLSYDKHVVYGRSLGTAVASHLAANVRPDLLILETPFSKISEVMPLFPLPKSRKNMFDNEKNLQNVRSKVVIIHGTDDRLTKLSGAQKLIPYLKPGDEFVIIEGGEHKNLREFEKFHSSLRNVL